MKFSNKEEPKKDLVKGAFDKDHIWWHEKYIKSINNAMIKLSFGKDKGQIQIIEVERKFT